MLGEGVLLNRRRHDCFYLQMKCPASSQVKLTCKQMIVHCLYSDEDQWEKLTVCKKHETVSVRQCFTFQLRVSHSAHAVLFEYHNKDDA